MIDQLSALRDKNLVGSGRGETYARWDAIWKAVEGKPLSKGEDRLFREVADRDPPRKPVPEFVAAIGRRGSKTSEAARVLLWRAISRDWRKAMAPGEVALFPFLASTREQAQVALTYARGLVRNSPLLAQHVERDTQEGFVFDNGAEVAVMSANYRSLRGRSIPCAVLDETAFWPDGLSVDLPNEAYAALRPSMATFADPLLILISSVYRKSGLFYERWEALYGRDDPDGLAILGTSQQFNPTLSEDFIVKELSRDPARNRAEYLSEWRMDVERFVSLEALRAVVAEGRHRSTPSLRQSYRAFVDPSGGSNDALAIAIGHTEEGKTIVDLVHAVQPPFDPELAVDEVCRLLREYNIRSVTGDSYAAAWVSMSFQRRGVNYKKAEKVKSELYLNFLAAIMSGRIELPNNEELVQQIYNLERSTTRNGREVVDHPRGQHDDLANAVAGLAEDNVRHNRVRVRTFEGDVVFDSADSPDQRKERERQNLIRELGPRERHKIPMRTVWEGNPAPGMEHLYED